ncbi:MAG TPA: hypothetical protein VJT13_14430 [Xanthobacteraceae bacterium]|nr:hypothetical protein [Xanthobacteraceae bacterium]
MAADQRLGPAGANQMVYCDPCLGLGRFIVHEPQDFWMGRAIVLAAALVLLVVLLVLALPG